MSRSKRMTDVHVCRCARADWKPTVEQANFVRSPVPFPPVLLDSCDSRWRNYVVLTTLAVRSVRITGMPEPSADTSVCWRFAFDFTEFHFAARDIFLVSENMRDTVTHVIVSSESHRQP